MAEPAGWRTYLTLDDERLLAGCEVDRFRASGPGGQKRNKTDSAVRLRHRASGLESYAAESRSQHENRAKALRRLRLTIALALREPVDVAVYQRSETLGSRIRGGNIEVAERNEGYPAVVAELFDVLEAVDWRLSDAPAGLGLTTAAIGRFLEGDAHIFRVANERRVACGLTPLRPSRS